MPCIGEFAWTQMLPSHLMASVALALAIFYIICNSMPIVWTNCSLSKTPSARRVEEFRRATAFVVLRRHHTSALQQQSRFVRSHVQTPRYAMSEVDRHLIRSLTTPSASNFFQGSLIGWVVKLLVILRIAWRGRRLPLLAFVHRRCSSREVATSGCIGIKILGINLPNHLFHQTHRPWHGIPAVSEHALVLARGMVAKVSPGCWFHAVLRTHGEDRWLAGMCCDSNRRLLAWYVLDQRPEPISSYFAWHRNSWPSTSSGRGRQHWFVLSHIKSLLCPAFQPSFNPSTFCKAHSRHHHWKQSGPFLKRCRGFTPFCSALQVPLARSHWHLEFHGRNCLPVRETQPSKNQQQEKSCSYPIIHRTVAVFDAQLQVLDLFHRQWRTLHKLAFLGKVYGHVPFDTAWVQHLVCLQQTQNMLRKGNRSDERPRKCWCSIRILQKSVGLMLLDWKWVKVVRFCKLDIAHQRVGTPMQCASCFDSQRILDRFIEAPL